MIAVTKTIEYVTNNKTAKMTTIEIAKNFSTGEFEAIYDFLAADSEWVVVEEDSFIGKQAIIDHCKQVSNYFKSVSTRFNPLHIIADGNKVAISGTAEFLRDNKRISFVSACDLYEFNDANKIKKITSYCIQAK
jgi:ABC-type taurine transport system substrate-binding protein